MSSGQRHTARLRVVTPDPGCTNSAPCAFPWTLADLPSDLYRLRVSDVHGASLWENPLPERPDFAALDVWDVGVGSDGGIVRVRYATLFPFARGQHDADRRLAPEEVVEFIAAQFVPIVQETWRTQVEEWGFGAPLHPNWDGDNIVEVFFTAPPFALFDGTGNYTVYHNAQGDAFPERRIWLRSTLNTFQSDYASLVDHFKIVFAHEFFHVMQWNVLLTAGEGTTWRPEHYWQNAFIESQGRFAPSVQYPELELRRTHLLGGKSPYVGSGADSYLKRQVNVSYRAMEADLESKYDLALYWRFLYESCGGMDVVRAALEEMARHFNPDILNGMRTVMDAALARVEGPFGSYEESLIAFSRANYALRLENGRCSAGDPAACGGVYYDPDQMYAKPPLSAELDFVGTPVTYSGAIPSSYGADFIEVRLDGRIDGQPLAIRFQNEGNEARFSVQVWKIGPGMGLGMPYALSPTPEVLSANGDGAFVYAIPRVDRATYGRIALIITRLDANETADPVGAYELMLESTGET